MDRKQLGKRPVFVSKCDPDKSTRQPQFKYAQSLEKNKLFVKGLPFELTDKELREMFEAFGPLKDCRLVTYRNGHSKGIAYVEFEKAVSASNCEL
jgi:RNA recognition motif-containing protein